jgi:hypothetical protein
LGSKVASRVQRVEHQAAAMNTPAAEKTSINRVTDRSRCCGRYKRLPDSRDIALCAASHELDTVIQQHNNAPSSQRHVASKGRPFKRAETQHKDRYFAD